MRGALIMCRFARLSVVLLKITKNAAIAAVVATIIFGCSANYSDRPKISDVYTLSISSSTISYDKYKCNIPTLLPGKSSACGVLYSTYMKPANIPLTAFYFIPAKDDALPLILTNPMEIEGSIFGISDSTGMIFVDDISPGRYYLIVWAPYSWIAAVESLNEEKPRVFYIELGKNHDFGIIYVPWP